MNSPVSKGREAENAALEYLRKQGLILIKRNYRCRLGEIDLVMSDDKFLVFIEVRYRKSEKFGSSAESVNKHKQNKIIKTTLFFLKEFRVNQPVRFDVVAMSPDVCSYKINWIKDAFSAV